jgi:hypothetical protein
MAGMMSAFGGMMGQGGGDSKSGPDPSGMGGNPRDMSQPAALPEYEGAAKGSGDSNRFFEALGAKAANTGSKSTQGQVPFQDASQPSVPNMMQGMPMKMGSRPQQGGGQMPPQMNAFLQSLMGGGR